MLFNFFFFQVSNSSENSSDFFSGKNTHRGLPADIYILFQGFIVSLNHRLERGVQSSWFRLSIRVEKLRPWSRSVYMLASLQEFVQNT